jgi:hypothetical protein
MTPNRQRSRRGIVRSIPSVLEDLAKNMADLDILSMNSLDYCDEVRESHKGAWEREMLPLTNG